MLGSMRYFGYQIPIRITRIVLQSFLREQYKEENINSTSSRNVSYHFRRKVSFHPHFSCTNAHMRTQVCPGAIAKLDRC